MKIFVLCSLLGLFAMPSFALPTDTLAEKNSQELLVIFKNIVEKHATLDYVFGKTAYSVTQLPHTPHELSILDVSDGKPFWVDFSRIVVGKNVKIKDMKRGYFSLVFSKEVASKGLKRKPAKLEVYFATDIRKRMVDYDELQIFMKNLLKRIEEKL